MKPGGESAWPLLVNGLTGDDHPGLTRLAAWRRLLLEVRLVHYIKEVNTVEMTVENLQALLTVQEVAEMHDVPARVVRKAARATPPTIPGVIEVLGKYGFDPDKVANWTPPEPGTRVVGAKRPDGRRRYRIYLTPDEAANLLAQGFEVTDPRVAAAARRAAKSATKAESGDAPPVESGDADDLFADFGA